MTTDVRGSDGDLRDQIEGTFVFARRALRFWPTVPIVLVVGGIACALFFLIRKPTYRSETVVLYSQGASAADSPDQSGVARNVTVRMKELLMSRPKLERVVAEFGLYPEVRSDLGVAETVEEFKKHIDFRAPGGDTFSIAFTGRSPVEAQKVTARLAGLIIDQDAELRRKQARDTRDFLVAEKAKTEATLRAAERDLAAFMAKHPRFALDTTPLATGAAIRATVPGSSTAPSGGPGRVSLNALRVPAAPGSSSAVADPMFRSTLDADSDFARANAALVAARAHLAEQLERYTPAHPDVRAAASAVERAEARVAAQPPVSRAPVSAPTPAAPAPSSEAKPAVVTTPSTATRPSAAVTNSSATGAGDVVALETEWLKLTRAVTEARQRQDQVESALFKADILASSASGGHGLSMTIIDPAFLPARPEPPGRTLIAAIFLAVSLALGLFLTLLRAVLDDHIFEARDTSGLAELLVEVPRSSRRAHVAG
jgi:capsular polysaccharide biosynthesis protein